MNDIADDEYFKNAVITIEDDGVGMDRYYKKCLDGAKELIIKKINIMIIL